MPLSTVYKVITRYEAETRTAERRVERLTRKAERHARMVERAKNAWVSFKTIAKGAIVGGTIFGIGLLTRRMVSLTQRAQDAKIQIAAVFEQSNPGRFSANLKRAGTLFKKFQKSSITSPATSQDFLTLFGGAAPAIAPLGLSNDTIDKFISRAVPTAKAFTGGDFEQAGRDILQILQGRAGTDVKTFNSLKAGLFKATGAKNTEAFNKLAQAQPNKVFDALNKVLSTMDVVNKEFGTSFGGLISSLKEFSDLFLLAIGGPVIKTFSKLLKRWVDWFGDNQKAIEAIGETIGQKVGKGLELAVSLSGMILDNFKGILAIGSVIAARKVFGLAAIAGGAARGGLGGEFSTNLASARGIAGAAGRGLKAIPAGAVSALGEVIFGGTFGPRQDVFSRGIRGARAGIGRNFGAGATSILTPLQRAGGAVKSGGLSILSKGLPAIVSAFGTLSIAILPLTVIMGMLIGTFRVLKDKTNDATIFLNTSIDELFATLDQIALQFGFGGGFVGALKKLVDFLGTGVVGVLGIGVKVVQEFARAFSFMIAVFKGAALGIGTLISRFQDQGIRAAFDPNFVQKAFSDGMNQAFKERNQAELQALREQKKKKKEAADKAAADALKKGGDKAPNIRVTVNQTITTDANPDRIAFKIGEVIGDVMKKFPKAAVGVTAR